eukprot:TRINITY_DN722_c0_g1_i1.p1 TRINITY_DN722_c0_g1~~TRINITY_DN722_c0_g1_i1.p1  ORF type:complete len:260 (-),score=41.85 TRINITY_DN722_c0_g1_i1:44-772(-)
MIGIALLFSFVLAIAAQSGSSSLSAEDYAANDLAMANKLTIEATHLGLVNDQQAVDDAQAAVDVAKIEEEMARLSLEANHLDLKSMSLTHRMSKLNDVVLWKSKELTKIACQQADLTLEMDELTRRNDEMGMESAVLNDEIAVLSERLNKITHKLDRINEAQVELGIVLNDMGYKAAAANTASQKAQVLFGKYAYNSDYLGALSTYYSELSDYFTSLDTDTPLPVPKNPVEGFHSIYEPERH